MHDLLSAQAGHRGPDMVVLHNPGDLADVSLRPPFWLRVALSQPTLSCLKLSYYGTSPHFKVKTRRKVSLAVILLIWTP